MPCTSAILPGDASAKDIDTAMKLGAGKDHILIIFFLFASFELINKPFLTCAFEMSHCGA